MPRGKSNNTEGCVRKSELDYHSRPPVQKSIAYEYFQDINCEPFSHGSPIIFNVAGSNHEYIDMAKSYVTFSLHVVQNANDASLADTNDRTGASLSIVNNFMHSCFSTVELSLNGIYVTRAFSNYPQKAYLMNLLTYDENLKSSSQLQCEGWSTDEPTKFVNTTGYGFKQRKAWISRKVQLAGVLKLDISSQHKYLPAGVNLHLKCVQNDLNYILLDGIGEKPAGASTDAAVIAYNEKIGNYKIKIIDPVYRVKKIVLSADEQLRLIKEIRVKPFEIPIRRIDVTNQAIAPGLLNKTLEQTFPGKLPKILIIGFVRSDAYNGNILKSPFLYETFSMERIQCYVNGKSVASKPYEPDYEGKNYVHSYLGLVDVIGGWRGTYWPSISYTDFANGCCLYAFRLGPESLCDFVNPPQTGNVTIEIKFKTAHNFSINAVLFAEFDSTVYINETGQVTTDYQ